MKVFVQPSGRRVQPFDDDIGDTPILNRPLSSWLDQAIREAGLERIESLQAPCLVIPDNAFVTGSALRAFADGARGRDAVLVLGQSLFGEMITPVQPGVERTSDGWRFDAIRFVTPAGADPVDVVVDPMEHELSIDVPRGYRDSDEPVKLGLPRRAVATVHHWVHILWLNQLAGGIEVMQTSRPEFVLRGIWAAAKARSVNRWKVLGKLNRIGRGCDIHPTAVVEGSTLGDRVKIGPFARVSFAALDDDVEIMPQASVEASCLGRGAAVAQQSVLRMCTLYPEAVAAQYLMQQCVLGRRTVTTGGAFTLDMNFENDIRVALDGKLWSSGTRFLGSAFGHESRIGTGFYLASGRIVPNGYKLVRDPARVLSKLPDGFDPGETLMADGREIAPIRPPSTPKRHLQ